MPDAADPDPADAPTLRRLCALCQCLVDRDRWMVDPPAPVGGGPCAVCGLAEQPTVQEVWMTDAEVTRLATWDIPMQKGSSDK